MKATRKCSFCGKSFVTRSGMQRYCSEACQAEARRARMTQKNNLFKAVRPIMEIQHQEYLTFSKAAILMGCSRQYIYKLVAMGKLKASRISNRMAFIRRADIERMLESNPYHRILPGSTSTPKKSASSSFPAKKEKREKVTDEVPDFYSGEEVMSLYKVKQSWLYTTAKRNRIPICRIAGKNYYSKKHVDEFFGTAVDMDSITDWLLTEEAEEQFGMKPAALRAYGQDCSGKPGEYKDYDSVRSVGGKGAACKINICICSISTNVPSCICRASARKRRRYCRRKPVFLRMKICCSTFRTNTLTVVVSTRWQK